MSGNWGPHYWPWFLIVTSLAFLIPEVYALAAGQGANTLSEYAWGELHVTAGIRFTAHHAAWLLSLGMWAVFVFWITAHIWWQAFR